MLSYNLKLNLMKTKIIFFTTVFFFLLILNSSAQNSNRFETLVEKLNALPTSAMSKSKAITENFDKNDAEILLEYFASKKPSEISNLTTKVDDQQFYAEDLFVNFGDFGTIPVAGPYDINTISTLTNDIFAGDFDDTNTLYALDDQGNSLLTIDINTGIVTNLGPIIGLVAGHFVSGLSFDFTTSTMFLLTIDGFSSTQLYTLDTSTRIATQVGTGTGNPLGIWLEIDNNGVAYMADINTDLLYTIDKTTGQATEIGPLGININFAQDATINPLDNTLYMAGFLNTESNIYTVNLSTGATTLLGTSNDAEYGLFALQGDPNLSITDTDLSQINVYPNPASEIIYVEMPSTLSVVNITVHDIMGRNMIMDEINNNQLNIQHLSEGVYILQILTSQGLFTKKIIKK